MGWLTALVLAIVLLAAALYVLLGVAIIVTALVERRPVKPLVEVEPDDPGWEKLGAIASGAGPSLNPDLNPYAAPGQKSYAESQMGAASTLGFTAPRLFKHVKGGIYKTSNALTVSRSEQILAVIRWGTTASIRNEVTSLYSALDDGRYLVTSDRPTGARTPGFYDDHVFLGAAFAQLAGRHEERVQASGKNVRPLSPNNPLREYEDILERRARFLVEQGEAYWTDNAHTEFRSTLKGALKQYSLTFSTKHVDQSLRLAGQRNAM